jgi:outer membrane protein OmpA-like peptidoglycan-associated protein
MNGSGIDKSERLAAERSSLRNTNPWLASYRSDAVRSPRLARPAALSLRLWAGAGAVVALVLGISATEYVAAEGSRASPGHYPLDRNGGIAVSSENLDRYLTTLEERASARQFLLTFGDLLFSANSAQIGDSEKGELLRMADFLRDHPVTVAQIVGHADDRADVAGNSRLAEQRAAAVRSYLIVQGIDQSRLTAVSGAEPLPDNSVQYERVANRRVEILVQKPEPGQ